MSDKTARRHRKELDQAYDLGYLNGKQAQYEAMEASTRQRMLATARTMQKDAISAYCEVMNGLPLLQRIQHAIRLLRRRLT